MTITIDPSSALSPDVTARPCHSPLGPPKTARPSLASVWGRPRRNRHGAGPSRLLSTLFPALNPGTQDREGSGGEERGREAEGSCQTPCCELGPYSDVTAGPALRRHPVLVRGLGSVADGLGVQASLTRGMSQRGSSRRKPSPHCQSRRQELWEPGGQGDGEHQRRPIRGLPPLCRTGHSPVATRSVLSRAATDDTQKGCSRPGSPRSPWASRCRASGRFLERPHKATELETESSVSEGAGVRAERPHGPEGSSVYQP